ncbi:PAS domain-containing sensor histidine kinase [Devosia sp. ZB163]|uniref:PAS domain-containing sensor histidine kinase n=1 Tax=Devosia sp. ZB163 TaxID=3025938 RepID=UPI002361BDAB|nr:PAS domain-containing sensor histidine kinase [Devosia sp. ZB163]MDC9823742.1 PAS domain-containing sensor histidine kinase [Devosia sp. ZB163]
MRGAEGRPEALRRRAISTNARLILLASIIGLPAALYALTQLLLLPFILAVTGVTVGVIAMAFCQRGQYERAGAAQVYGTLLCGLLLTVADPAIADFGLAIAVLAPVQASLLSRTPVKKRAWAILVAVVGFGAAAHFGMLGWPEPFSFSYALMGGFIFCVAATIVAVSANRLNSVFEVYEKAQINAYRHLIEHVQDAVMRFAPDGTVLFTSRSSEKLFGCRRFELSGNGLIERIHVLDRPAYLTAFAEANQDGLTRRIEIRMRRDEPGPSAAPPKFVWVEVSLTPVIDEDMPRGRNEVVILLRDVTERHDQMIELQRARKAAEEASNAKSRFLATIGHELRTPLNAIVGFSEMMTSGVVGDLSPQHNEYATLIQQSGHHLIGVVRMLLDMSRLEAGKFELNTEPLAPESLVEPCLKMVDAMAREKSVRLMTDIPRTLPLLIADERACRQILINLLSNAVKFSNEHSVVTLAMKRQGRHLAISVADHGIGMGEESVQRIGEPFFQAQDGLARRYEGTGLGLSIVKGLVELHDGTLHASSSPGEGTVMTVLLPINGPETKVEETGAVTPLHRDPVTQHMPQWYDERKRAL